MSCVWCHGVCCALVGFRSSVQAEEFVEVAFKLRSTPKRVNINKNENHDEKRIVVPVKG